MRTRTVAVAAALWAVLACLPAHGENLDFPGPVLADLGTTTVSCCLVTGLDPGNSYIAAGTSDGFVDLIQYRPETGTLALVDRYYLGGIAVSMIPAPDVAQGAVLAVAVANPDRVAFLSITAGTTWFTLTGQLDLPEDPGRIWPVALGDAREAGLAVTLPGMDRMVILRRGGAVWRLDQDLPMGDRPFHGVAGDLDGDGRQELYVSQLGYLSENVAILQQDAAGLFQRTGALDPVVPPGPIGLFDMYGVGRQDLVLASSGSPEIRIFERDGGVFTLKDQVPVVLPADELLLAVMQDGRPAMVTANTARGLVDLVVRDGAGWLSLGSFHPGCRPVYGLAADISSDGRFDLVWAGDSPGITVVYADSDRVLWAPRALVLPGDPLGLALADVFGSGERAAVVSSRVRPALDVFPGWPATGFAVEPVRVDVDFLPLDIVGLAPLDSGPQPVAVTDPQGGRLRVLQLAPDGTSTVLADLDAGGEPLGVLAVDVDGDGLQDLMYLRAGWREVNIAYGLGEGRFATPVKVPVSAVPVTAVCVDLDGDGDRELVLSDGFSLAWIKPNLGGRSFGSPVFLDVGANPDRLAGGDLDGDGDLDVAVHNSAEPTVSLLENNGAGGLVTRLAGVPIPEAASSFTAADITGDGRAEVVAGLRDTGQMGVILMDDQWQGAIMLTYPGGRDPVALEAGDFNRDGLGDVLLLDRDLQLGLSMLNGSRTLVAVDPAALAVTCETAHPRLIITPELPGQQWVLEGGPDPVRGPWTLLADPGWAASGTPVYDRGSWIWDPEPGFTAMVAGGLSALRLRVGQGATEDTLIAVWKDPCAKEGGSPPPALAWARRPWPNPFNPTVNFRLTLARRGEVTVGVYDLRGRLVRMLHRGAAGPGTLDLRWDGSGPRGSAAAGIYIVRGAMEQGRVAAAISLVR